MTLNVILERRRHVGDPAPAPSTAFPAQMQARRSTSSAALLPLERRRHGAPTNDATAAVAASVASEAGIRAGGGVVTISVAFDAFVAAGATFNAQRQAILDGLVGSLALDTTWNDVVAAALAVTDVTRLSASQVTVTLPAVAAYALPAGVPELVTVTVPAAALDGGVALLAGSFTIAADVVQVLSPPRVYLRVNGRAAFIGGAA